MIYNIILFNMIEKMKGINPEKKDIGRRVINSKHEKGSHGFITEFNDEFVFVKYGWDTFPEATKREDLSWG